MPWYTDPLQALDALRQQALPQLLPLPAALQPPLRGLLSLRRLPQGRLLYAQGERPSALYAVLQGEVATRLRAADGAESLLEHVGPLRLFGLAAFAAGLPSRYEAAASRPTQLLVIGEAAYVQLMDGWPGFARALLAEFARRFDANLHQLESARHRSAPERLQLALAQLKRERAVHAPGGGWQLQATQAELALLAGVTRQTANAWLRQQGLAVGYRGLASPGSAARRGSQP